MKTAVVVGALLLCGCRMSCSAGRAQTLIWDRYGFRITLPPRWQQRTDLENGGLYVSVDETHLESIVINPPSREEQPKTGVRRFFFEDMEPKVTTSPSYQRIKVEFVDVDGFEAVDWWYHLQIDGRLRLRGQRLIFRGNERLLAAVSSPDLDSDRLDDIIASFRPIEKKEREQLQE